MKKTTFLGCLKFTNHEESRFFFAFPFLMMQVNETHGNKYNHNMCANFQCSYLKE